MVLSFWPVLLTILAVITLCSFLTIRRHNETAESTQAANRTVEIVLGSLAICASWSQATAIYGSGIYAAQGPWYFVMLYVPNVLSIPIIVAPYLLARRLVPEGLTLGEYMIEVYGPRVRILITLMQQGIVIVSCVGSLIAARDVIPQLLGYKPTSVGRYAGGFALAWVFITGILGGLVADRFKFGFLAILAVGVGYLWWSASTSGALDLEPVYTKKGESFWSVLWNPGIPLWITLFGAVFCFPDIFERTNSLVKDPRSQRLALYGAAALFAVVLLVFGSAGFLKAIANVPTTKEVPFPIFPVLQRFGSPDMIVIAAASLGIVLTAGLAAYAASFGSLGSVENFQWYYTSYYGVKPPEWARVWVNRLFMPVPILVAIWIVETWPGLRLQDLLEYSAAFRGESIAPVVAAPLLVTWLGVEITRKYDGWISAWMLAALLYGVAVNLKFFGIHLYEETSFLGQNAKTLSALCAFFFPIIGFCIGLLFVDSTSERRLQSAE